MKDLNQISKDLFDGMDSVDSNELRNIMLQAVVDLNRHIDNQPQLSGPKGRRTRLSERLRNVRV